MKIEIQGRHADNLLDDTTPCVLQCVLWKSTPIGLWIIGNDITELATSCESILSHCISWNYSEIGFFISFDHLWLPQHKPPTWEQLKNSLVNIQLKMPMALIYVSYVLCYTVDSYLCSLFLLLLLLLLLSFFNYLLLWMWAAAFAESTTILSLDFGKENFSTFFKSMWLFNVWYW